MVNEQIGPRESELIKEIVDATIAGQNKEHKKGTKAKRDVHRKSHGTVHAQFHVLPNIPAALKVGIFAQPATYSALVRFSNGALPTMPDILPNIRGLAIKLLDVPGDKLLVGQETSTQHDFLLANDRTFFVDHLEYMVMMAKGQMGQVVKQNPRILLNMAKAMLKFVKNPMQTSYFSQVPYLCGEQAVKYALIPQTKAPFFSIPNIFAKDYLRLGVTKLLRKGEVKMTFCVQMQQDGEELEDSTKLWRGELVPVAEITFQHLGEPVLESDGEGLAFNPWRVRKEHRPLGWPGRVRGPVYQADFNWRSNTNKAEQ